MAQLSHPSAGRVEQGRGWGPLDRDRPMAAVFWPDRPLSCRAGRDHRLRKLGHPDDLDLVSSAVGNPDQPTHPRTGRLGLSPGLVRQGRHQGDPAWPGRRRSRLIAISRRPMARRYGAQGD